MGSQVAKQMLPDGIKRLAPSGSAVVGQEMRSDPVALGKPALSLLDVIPVVAHALIRRDRRILLSLRLETRSGTNRCGRSPATRPRRRSAASSPKPHVQAFSVTADELDADPWLFNCQNGT